MVLETNEILSERQRATLEQVMSEINPTNGLTEAVLVHQFTSARTFVQSCVQQAESGSEA